MKLFAGKEEKGYQKVQRRFKKEIEQLERLGYCSFQVKELLNGYLNREIGTTEEDEIRTMLIQQIEFAKKAMKSLS